MAGCASRQVFITDVKPGPRGSLVVSRCTLVSTWFIFDFTSWYDCKDGLVRAAPDEAAKPAAESTK